ncbi:MAG: VOC family protein [Oscillospiraceae bacterium]|nr:VOC family protein [Candidatus Equicaccousia limihippi]
MKVHHVGYLVKKIEPSLSAFKNLGFSVQKEPVFDKLRMVDICFIEKDGYCVELIAPHENSKIYPLLKQYKNTPYHLCYSVFDIEESIAALKAQGFMQFMATEKAPAIGENARVVFMMHPSVGIIELVEEG